MTEAPPHPKPAATVLLVRDAPQLEVLMVRRSSGMAFGASAWVFPGGKVAGADADEAWQEFSDGSYSAYERSCWRRTGQTAVFRMPRSARGWGAFVPRLKPTARCFYGW